MIRVRSHVRKGRPVREHQRRSITDIPPRLWVLPVPPIHDTWHSSNDVVLEDPALATIEEYPTRADTNREIAADQAKDVYWEDAADRASILRLAKRIQRGEEIDAPVVLADADTGEVHEFDGGHRLRAAMIAGLPTIPVIVQWMDYQTGKVVAKKPGVTLRP